MTQSKLGSFVEAWGNVAIGFGVNFTANLLILPYFGFTTLTVRKNLEIGVLFTVVSVARSYAIRRWFNGFKFTWNVDKDVKDAQKLELGEEKVERISERIGREDRNVAGGRAYTLRVRDVETHLFEGSTESRVPRVPIQGSSTAVDVYSGLHTS